MSTDNNADNQINNEPVELLIQFEGDEESHTSNENEGEDNPESSVIRELRKQVRTQAQELAKLKPASNQETIVLGDKPDLVALDYDTDKYEQELAAYYDRKNKLAQQENDKLNRQTQEQQTQTKQLQEYETQAKALNAKDFEAKQSTFLEYFNDTDQGRVIFKAAKNKALVVYALGSDEKKLEQLSKITDPVELAAEIARIEGKIKVQNRQTNIKPEGTIRGSAAAPSNSSVKNQLAKLEAEAAKTGNRTEVAKFKKANNLL